MIRQAISCDICGRDKQQTNRWFVVYEHGAELRVSGWNSQARMNTKAKHLCGQTCLHKLIDEYMARMLATGVFIAGIEAASEERKLTAPSQERKPSVPIEEKKPTVIAQPRTDASLTSAAAHKPALPAVPAASDTYSDDCESSARLIPSAQVKRPAAATQPRPEARPGAVLAIPKPAPVAPPEPEADIDEYESSARLISPSESIADPEMELQSSPSFNSRAWRAEAWKREREREQRNARNTVHPRRRSLV